MTRCVVTIARLREQALLTVGHTWKAPLPSHDFLPPLLIERTCLDAFACGSGGPGPSQGTVGPDGFIDAMFKMTRDVGATADDSDSDLDELDNDEDTIRSTYFAELNE